MTIIPKIIAVDFDGTVVTHDFPLVGQDIGAAGVLRELREYGHRIILHTMRSGHSASHNVNYLADAINWFNANDISLWGINSNPEQHSWTHSPKPFANLYIDDMALGAPLIPIKDHPRKALCWKTVREMLVQLEYLPA